MRALDALVLAALLLPATAVAAPGPVRAAWWDAERPFRLAFELGGIASDPTTGTSVKMAGVRDPLILVDLDLTERMLAAGDWPVDAAGLPADWVPALETARLLELDESGSPVAETPARFLTTPLRSVVGHHTGTLAVALNGTLDAPRRFAIYFALAGSAPSPAPIASGRLDALFGPGPLVATRVRVPSLAPDADLSLALIPVGSERAHAVVRRHSSSTAPTTLADLGVPAAGALIPLPIAEGGYDLDVRTDTPVVATLVASTAGDPAPSVVHASADGGRSGARTILSSVGDTLDVVGVQRTSYRIRDLATDRVVAQGDVARLGASRVAVPRHAPLEVVADAPVIVMTPGDVQGDATLAQAVSPSGSATGSLVVLPRARGLVALSDEVRTLQAYPLARPHELSSGRAGEAPRFAWTSAVVPGALAEPWAVVAEGARVEAVAGSGGFLAIQGATGTAFTVPLPASESGLPLAAALSTLLPDTRVRATLRALNGTLLHESDVVLSRPGALTTMPDGTRALGGDGVVLHIETDRPATLLVSRPRTSGATVLAGMPPLVSAEAGSVESTGASLRWTEPSKELAAKAGEIARASLTLSSRGRNDDGSPRVEDVALELRRVEGPCEQDWEASLSEAWLLGLASPGERTVVVLAQVPADARSDDCTEHELVATTRGGEASAQARIVVRARSSFEIELRALAEDGAQRRRLDVRLVSEENVTITLRVSNPGATGGSATFATSSAPGYSLTWAGAGTVALGPGESRDVTLVLRAGTVPSPWDIVVEARSTTDSTTRDQVVLRASPRTNATFEANATVRELFPTRTVPASTTVRVGNAGPDVEVQATIASPVPDGWDVSLDRSRVVLREKGAIDPEGVPLDRADLRLDVTVPPDAKLGTRLPIVLRLEPTGSPEAARTVGLVATVANNYPLEPEVPRSTVAAPLGTGLLKIPLQLRDAFDVSVVSLRSVEGWNATAHVEGGALRLSYAVAAGAPPGTGALRIQLRFTDGTSPPSSAILDVPVETSSLPVLRASASPAIVRLPMHGAAHVRVVLRNDGNAPAAPLLPPTAPPGVIATFVEPPRTLGPGEGAILTLRLERVGDLPPANVSIADARVALLPARADAAIARVERLDGDAVRVHLENRGDLATGPLLLVARTDDDERRLAEQAPLPAGANATRVVLVPRGATKIALMDTALPMDDESSNNQHALASADERRDAPAAHLWLAIVMALGLAGRRRT